jgi:hypothetical protein
MEIHTGGSERVQGSAKLQLGRNLTSAKVGNDG